VINPNDTKSGQFDVIKNVAKFVLPVPARAFLHTTHRAIVFHRAMKKFLSHLELSIPFNRRVILDLIYGWGNESWSSGEEYLLGCLEQAQASRGPILECGSGLSTLLVGAVVQKSGNVLHSLEHQPAWGNRVAKLLKRYGIKSVHLYVHPLKAYTDFTWYEPPSGTASDQYAMVVCDGPPGATRGGRYGLVPVMKTQLAPGCVILLDDASREQEQTIANRWAAELNTHYETLGSAKPYIRIELGKNI
jgi:hypothetical protein